MACLPVRYIFLWLYRIQIKTPEFENLLFEVYDALSEFSFNPQRQFTEALKENTLLKIEVEKAKQAMYATKEGIYYLELANQLKESNHSMVLAKKNIVVTQLLLWKEEAKHEANNKQLN